MTSSVRKVVRSTPPITVIAIGARTSAPSPIPSAIGSSPSMVVSLVIRMGRRRILPASMMASRFDRPRSRAWLTASISTIDWLTTIPASMMSPMYATTLTVVPVIHNAQTAPMIASGMVSRITKGCIRDSNCDAITR
jgi:hypothetical protein